MQLPCLLTARRLDGWHLVSAGKLIGASPFRESRIDNRSHPTALQHLRARGVKPIPASGNREYGYRERYRPTKHDNHDSSQNYHWLSFCVNRFQGVSHDQIK